MPPTSGMEYAFLQELMSSLMQFESLQLYMACRW